MQAKIYLGNGEWKQIFKGGDFLGSAVRYLLFVAWMIISRPNVKNGIGKD